MSSEMRVAPRMSVVEAIRQWIAQGKLAAGAAIPSERFLSAELHVQRPTVRRALEILEQQGVIARVSPHTRVVTQQNRPMAYSIVVSAISPMIDDNGRPRRGAPWGTIMFQAVIDEISKRGYDLVLTHPDRATAQHVEQLASGRPSGVIVPETNADGELQLQWSDTLRQAGIPMVVYGGGPELAAIDRVISDHEQGSCELTRFLIGRGCRRILMFFEAQPDLYWVNARRAGYERAMAEAGLAPLPLITYPHALISQTSDPDEVFDAARRRAASYLLEHLGSVSGAGRVDAIMTASDGETFAVAGACRLFGCVPGQDVQIVGYDNYWRETWEHAVESATPLATVDKHNAAIGRELVSLLVDRIEGRLPPQSQVRVVRPRLVIEQNTVEQYSNA